MATILAIILAVGLDRYARNYAGGKVLQNARSSAWLNPYLVKSINFLDKISIKQNYIIILSVLLPLCIALFVVKMLFGMLFGERIAQFLFVAITLFYFLGNSEVEDNPGTFVLTHETSFGILFWYALLGFTGAFLYWFFVLAKQCAVLMDPIHNGLRQTLIVLHALAAWLPARITGFLYALVGNFEPGFKAWISCAKDAKMPSSQVLQDCGTAAVASSNPDDAVGLVNRAFIAWVVFVIVVVLL